MSTATTETHAGEIPAWTLADRLRKARIHAGLEQGELADRASLSREAISLAERGKVRPHRATLRLWALATGVSLEWIEKGEVGTAPSVH